MKLASTTRMKGPALRGGRLTRLVQAGVAACALALSCGSAFAQRHGGQEPRFQDPAVQQQDPRMQDPRMQDPRLQQRQEREHFDPRAFDYREYDDRRQHDPGMRQEGRRGSRLTPDERRDLRRQINEAGMDLYPHPSRR